MLKQVVNTTPVFSKLGFAVAVLFAVRIFSLWETCDEWECLYVQGAAYPWEFVINRFLYYSNSLGFLFADISRFDETAMIVGIVINAMALYLAVAGLQTLFRRLRRKR